MRARQPNAQERERLRRQRSETRMILSRCRALGGRAYHSEYLLNFLLIHYFLRSAGFEYVVNPPVLPKVAFGSTMHREVMPLKGPFMNGFMKKNLPEPREHPSPLDYNCAKSLGFKVSYSVV